jgi:ppGpp synthetase/RelA/SpoT-type nucleotidyltranferase
MTRDLDDLRAAFSEDQDGYLRLCEWATERLRSALKPAPIYYPLVDGRPKDVQSFLKKAILNNYENPKSDITDRAGVRIIVTFRSDIVEVEKVILTLFDVIERTDKSEDLDDDRLGYLGVHYLVKRRSDDETASDVPDFVFEVQIHSKAENAWAGASHRLLYKPVGGKPSVTVRRRVNRLVALVEIFDQEVDAAWKQIVEVPGYEQGAMLLPLERHFLALAAYAEFDEELSLKVLGVLRGAYTEGELGRFPELIDQYVLERHDYIKQQLSQVSPETSNPFMMQPEVIAILERLETAKERLRASWDAELPSRWLDSLSEELGRPA